MKAHRKSFVAGLAVAAGVSSLAFRASAQMKTGESMKDWHAELRLQGAAGFEAVLIESNAPANIFWPGERPRLSFQLRHAGVTPLHVVGHIEIVEWATEGIPGDIWLPQVRNRGVLQRLPIKVDLPAAADGKPGWSNFTVEFDLPERNLGWMAIVDLGGRGRRLLTHGVRTFAADDRRSRHPHQAMEEMPPEVLQRLNIRAVRKGIDYAHSSRRGLLARYESELRALHERNVTVLAEFGAGGAPQPLDRPRPHLDADGVMLEGKMDHVWLPELDADFKAEVKKLVGAFGWPKGPITGVMLWNEPWEGSSISGWQADMIRYREIYRAMAEAVHEAEKEFGVQVLVGGADSSTNTWDKFFPDGSDEFLEYLDFCSIHYQGMHSPAHFKMWRERKNREGRVLIFDTESWVANTDDRYAAVVAANRAAGYDRAMGVYGGNVVDVLSHGRVRRAEVWSDRGREQIAAPLQAFPLAASVGAVQHFIGDRPFREVLFERGLPWVFVFDGYDGNAGDGTVVVLGDLDALFGRGHLWGETPDLAGSRARLELLSELNRAETPERKAEIENRLAERGPYRDAKLVVSAMDAPFAMFDFTGNRLPPSADGSIVVPLDHRGFFLRATDGKAESFEALLAALRAARVEGLAPIHIVARDFLQPVEDGAVLRLELTSHHNQPIEGALRLTIEGLQAEAPARIRLEPRETLRLDIPVKGAARADNTYPLSLVFDAGDRGVAVHREALHVNRVVRRTVRIDGQLDDWRGAIPQAVSGAGAATRTLTEEAWLPFAKFAPEGRSGFATAWLAYDDEYFYFAARISDATPDPGTLRFAERDDDQFFYPEISYRKVGPSQQGQGGAENFSARWSGFLQARATGPHTLILRTDDGVRLWLDGRQVINDWSGRAPADSKVEVELTAGKRMPIRIEYFQGGGGAVAQFQWIEPGGERMTVPAEALFAAEAGEAPGLKAEFFAGTGLDGAPRLTRVDAVIDYAAWPALPWAGAAAAPRDDGLAAMRWPEGVRRFTYRRDPILPAGNRSPDFDNVQIAFNVLPPDQQGPSSSISKLPGSPERLIPVVCTDHEYALNHVAPEFGGGFEVWRLTHPTLPRKHFYPRQPKAPNEGPVEGAKMITVYRDGLRITEAAIPWAEMPAVKAAVDEGRSVKFSYRVNYRGGGPTLELARRRSVSLRSPFAFQVDWAEHWSNDLEFSFEP